MDGKRKMAANTIAQRQRLAESLNELGFYRFVESEDMPSIKQALVDTGWVFEQMDDRVLGEVDYVDLPEGDIASFLEYYRSGLEKYGVHFDDIREERAAEHTVTVNAVRYLIQTEDDEQMFRYAVEDMLNDLLKRAGAAERIYWAGEPGYPIWVLITPQMRDVLKQYAAVIKDGIHDVS
jgi:hypothetical protein